MSIHLVVLARRTCALLLCLSIGACGGGDGGGTGLRLTGGGTGTIAPVIPPDPEANCKP